MAQSWENGSEKERKSGEIAALINGERTKLDDYEHVSGERDCER